MLLDLNTNIDNQIAGFRLQRLEVLNWGTFDGEVWHIEPGGRNALLTGDIGSGKSTLVDAITTLMVPSRKITYNKAAGAETRERSVLSYVKGAYKNEKVANSAKARDVYLRDGKHHYTVLIANFANAGTNEAVALAQVLWVNQESVKKFYVLGDRPLRVDPDFTDFGGDINSLKRRLRKETNVHVFNSFNDYSDQFRQRFGIRQPEALDLFYQTVSMKSVGNLTDFVRERMLGQTDIEDSIEQLVRSYADATAAHAAVQNARRQLEVLDPLIREDRERAKLLDTIAGLEAVGEEIPRYFAARKIGDGQHRLAERHTAWRQNEAERESTAQRLDDRRAVLLRLNTALSGHSLQQQLAPLKAQIAELGRERDRRRARADEYAAELAKLPAFAEDQDWTAPTRAEDFITQQTRLSTALEAVEAELSDLNRREPELHVRAAEHRERRDELDRELDSLRRRPTAIPRRSLDLREQLLRELNLAEAELPFAGELLRVRPEAKEWEGAIERLLNGLGLSLLVADRHYAAVSELVNRRHLGGKLVYLRTLDHRKNAATAEPDPASLVRKVRIKGDTEHYQWLERELIARYDYTCCETMEEFRRAAKGVTRQGQSKSGRWRHVKDDRRAVTDRGSYVLGWTNQEKIAALEEDLARAEAALAETTRQLAVHAATVRASNTRRDQLRVLLRYRNFEEMDFAATAHRLQRLEEERRRLESQSDELRQLEARIEAVDKEVKTIEKSADRLSQQRGSLQNEILQLAQGIYDQLELLGLPAPAERYDPETDDIEPFVTAYLALDPPATTPSETLAKLLRKFSDGTEQPDRLERELLGQVAGPRGRIARRREVLAKLERGLERQMQKFRYDFPDESREIDADLRALPDYRRLHEQLRRDKLPDFEDKFRALLKEGTIRGIVGFQSLLGRYEGEIRDKIESINEHLREIDYNPETYIAITSEPVKTEDILSFKQDLRACLEGTFGATDETEVYTERKFSQVKKLLDRFQGGSEENQRWTRQVTDVRQWYNFGADERYRATDESREYFSDSSGKSGGQKEKLAYTILASAIAFQFGLQFNRSTDRSFRFVVIDEAFGRGSDESTRYGLRLFERLNLQLLIVTPLQKINVIEDHIANVHFVSNEGGRRSLVRNIGIEAYRREKAAYLAQKTNSG